MTRILEFIAIASVSYVLIVAPEIIHALGN